MHGLAQRELADKIGGILGVSYSASSLNRAIKRNAMQARFLRALDDLAAGTSSQPVAHKPTGDSTLQDMAEALRRIERKLDQVIGAKVEPQPGAVQVRHAKKAV